MAGQTNQLFPIKWMRCFIYQHEHHVFNVLALCIFQANDTNKERPGLILQSAGSCFLDATSLCNMVHSFKQRLSFLALLNSHIVEIV